MTKYYQLQNPEMYNCVVGWLEVIDDKASRLIDVRADEIIIYSNLTWSDKTLAMMLNYPYNKESDITEDKFNTLWLLYKK